jgi:hypothetical protein
MIYKKKKTVNLQKERKINNITPEEQQNLYLKIDNEYYQKKK